MSSTKLRRVNLKASEIIEIYVDGLLIIELGIGKYASDEEILINVCSQDKYGISYQDVAKKALQKMIDN